MRIRRGDMVLIVNGDDAGETPRKVLQILKGGEKLVVEGVNRVYKHVRRGHPKSPQGGRLSVEMPVHCSNVSYFCQSCGKGSRVGYRIDSEGRKERYCKKCDAGAGAVGAAKAKRVAAT